MRSVIVNADDFGLSEDTVRATVDCIEAGAVASATIMTGMPGTDAAIAYAQGRPDISFGVHLLFVGDGEERPASDPSLVPSLVGPDGALRTTNVTRLRALLGRLSPRDIATEIEAQVTAVASRGVPVSHVDSHRHLHKFPPFVAALRSTLPRLGVRRVRRVQDVYLRPPLHSPTYWLGARLGGRVTQGFATTDHFYMPASSGDAIWAGVLDRVPASASLEIGVHPGRDEEWRAVELQGTMAFADAARERGVVITGWNSVPVRVAGGAA